MKEPIGWQIQAVYNSAHVAPERNQYRVIDANGTVVADVRNNGRPLVEKRHAQLIARAGRMQAAIKAVITSLDTGGESSRTLAREIAILRQSLK